MYTIGQVADMFGIPISTLRYYDREGLFPDMQRSSGIRRFSGIKSIKQFMEWCSEGSETYGLRQELFLKRKAAVEGEIRQLEKTLDMLRFKCWYYEQAIQDGNEDRLNRMLPDKLPKEIQVLYDHGHET